MVNRFFAGVVCGLFSGIFPMYLNECAPKNLRGRIGVINQLALVFGILVVNIIGLDVVLGTAELWPVIFGLSLVPTLIHTGLFFTVESPKYMFINKGNEEATRSILLKLRENDERLVQAEIDDLADEKQRIAQQDQVTWGDMVRRPSLRRALVVTVVLQLSQQLSGINAVIFYSTGIFESAGLSWASYATLLIGGVQLIMTLLCMLIIDKAGRKPLLLIGQIGMSLFSFALALTLIFKSVRVTYRFISWFVLM
jgi:SP family facilitated glucose transporter-like MFS transporter 3